MILMIKKWILMVGLIVVVIIPAINLIINAGHIDGLVVDHTATNAIGAMGLLMIKELAIAAITFFVLILAVKLITRTAGKSENEESNDETK